MGQSFHETNDGQGRMTLELRDDPPVILLVCALAGVAPAFFFGEAALWFALANFIVFGSLSAWFTFARARMRVTVEPAARTLTVTAGRRLRVVSFDEVQGARVAGGEGRPGNQRVELVLRSGEALSLYVGLGGFREENCRHLADRINAALA